MVGIINGNVMLGGFDNCILNKVGLNFEGLVVICFIVEIMYNEFKNVDLII